MSRKDLRAARANRVLGTDKKRIRTKNTVLDKSKGGWGWFSYKIVDCARMCFSSVRNRRSARTGRRPRKIWRCSSTYPVPSARNRRSWRKKRRTSRLS